MATKNIARSTGDLREPPGVGRTQSLKRQVIAYLTLLHRTSVKHSLSHVLRHLSGHPVRDAVSIAHHALRILNVPATLTLDLMLLHSKAHFLY